ncbi:MAG: UDP-N-acetylmuramoyl-L-alanine--D-glutamate ligase, partial [Polyangiales bacterium]
MANTKKAVVVGLGASGEAAARLLAREGYEVTATDSRKNASTTLTNMRVVLGTHDGVDLRAADVVVVSPGVPNLPWLRDAERKGVRIVGELELASWFVEAPILAIGGTNGKST